MRRGLARRSAFTIGVETAIPGREGKGRGMKRTDMQLHILLGPVAVWRSTCGTRVLDVVIQIHPQKVEAVHLVDGLELYGKTLESQLRVVEVDVPRRV